MARQAVDQGVTHVGCKPHILPGVYHDRGPGIRSGTNGYKPRSIAKGFRY
jgi:hypothetical protein